MSSFQQPFPFESAVQLPRFQTKNGEQIIEIRRIFYLSGQGNYARFHLNDGETVITSHSLMYLRPRASTSGVYPRAQIASAQS